MSNYDASPVRVRGLTQDHPNVVLAYRDFSRALAHLATAVCGLLGRSSLDML